MPIYEYHCLACGHELEALQRMSDDPLAFCPECNEEKLKKKISAAAFQLKGTGWYETDFKNSGKKENKPSVDKSGDKSSTQKDTAKSKPDSKSKSKSTSTTSSRNKAA